MHEHWPLGNIASATIPSIKFLDSLPPAPSPDRPPPCHIELDPPTSNPPVVTEGIVLAMYMNWRAVGRLSSSSFETTSRRVLDCTSTTGLTPVTVTVSATDPTRISTLIGPVKSASSTTPSRTPVLNPTSVKVTVYVRGRGPTIRYWPTALVF